MSRPKLLFLVACPTTFAEVIPFLGSNGFDVAAGSIDSNVCDQVSVGQPELVVIEHLDKSGHSALDVASDVRKISSCVSIVVATAEGSEELAIGTLRAGLQDYVKMPASPAFFLDRVRAHLPRPCSSPAPADNGEKGRDVGRILAASDSMEEIKRYLQRAAKTNCTVLVTGETGTGKELVAEFIHENSPRRQKPFVCINCAAIPESLLESELFGYTKGAFTGAQELRDGLLCAAEGGTVFLDEIGDLSSMGQTKILRVLETKQFCRLGGTRQLHLDLRFVAATNQDLYALTAQKAFRQDLLFRLDVAHVHLPPLRERKEDIPLLLREFGRQFSEQSTGQVPEFTEEFLRVLLKYVQQQAGNQAVQQLLRSGYIQAKLAISNPDDSEEREADQVAHTIMRSRAGAPSSTPCSCSHDGEMCEECQQKQSLPTISRRASAPTAPAHVPRIVSDVLRSPGYPLDAATRAFFEPRFGHDLSKVRVHTDAKAAESAQTVDAYAYTVGHDIAFAAGQFRPRTDDGRRLLAHELAHVLQQSRMEPFLQRAPSQRTGQPPPSPAPQGDCPKREPGEASASSIQYLVRVPNQEYLIYGFPVGSSLVDMTKWDFVSLTIAYSLAKRAQLAKGGVTNEVKILGYSDCGENLRIRMERSANFCGEMMKICKDEYGHRALPGNLFVFSPSCGAAAPQTYIASNATEEDRRQNRAILIRVPPPAKSSYAYDETYGPTAANCDHYLTMRDWLSPAYAHNAFCACMQTPDEPHNNCVRECLKSKAWMFVFDHRNDLRAGRLTWWCPNIWIQHRECYRECGCDHTFIDYLGFMIMCEQEMSCGATGLAIGLLNQCMG